MAKPSGCKDSSGSKNRSLLGRLCRIFGWLVLILLILYGASNLWLSSSWGTGIAEAKLKQRTGHEWEIDSMTWSPWNGISIYEAQMLNPKELRDVLDEPVVHVEQIRVKPYWSQLLRGRAWPREVLVDTPNVNLSVEMLAALVSGISPAKVATPSAKQPVEPATPSRKEPTAKPPIKVDPKKGQQQPPQTTPQPTPPKEISRPPAQLPISLKIDNASFRIVSASKGINLLNVEGVAIEMPIFGEDASGLIKIASAKIPGLAEINDLEQSVIWKRPYFELEGETVDVGGVNIRFLGQLGMGRSNMGRFPFLFDIAIEPQELEPVSWFERLALEVSAGKIFGRFRVSGLLPRPMSWRSDLLFVGKNMGVKEVHGEHDVVFDDVYLPAVMRQGRLQWNNVRMIGEDVSVLGNGQISVEDGVLAVTRLVVSPEVAGMLTRGICGADISDSRSCWWEDLDTPDRKMRDLLVSGTFTNLEIDAGDNHGNIQVKELVASVLKFIREEMKEEGKVLSPIPNKELLNGAKHEDH